MALHKSKAEGMMHSSLNQTAEEIFISEDTELLNISSL